MTTQPTPNGADQSRPRNRTMTMAQTLVLCDQIRSHHKKFMDEKVTLDEAAVFLSHRCGFPVTERNVRSAREATGCTWKSRRVGNTGERMSLTWALYEAVVSMLIALGQPVPQNLLEAAEKVRKDREDKQRKAASSRTT